MSNDEIINESKPIEKRFKGWLVLDYRSGKMRVVKVRPSTAKSKPYEIPIQVDINVLVKQQVPGRIEGTYHIEPATVAKLILEEL